METPQTTTTPGRIKWIAVVVGFLLDTLISTLIFGIAAQIEPDLSTTITLTTTVGLITACLLVLSTGIGGWLAARLARTEFVLHGVLVGGLGIFSMLLEALIGGQAQPLNAILLQCVACGVGGIGGWLSGRMLASRT
jgi:putative membrane protein (TIGR04086 family)